MTSGRALPDLLLEELADRGKDAGVAPYLVGGALRDAFLGREPVDLDVALEGPLRAVEALTRALEGRGWAGEARHPRFGTATLRSPGGTRVDFAATREETYPHPGALPLVRCGAPIAVDLGRRDFTVHAMARRLGPCGLEGPLIDPFGGAVDAGRRCLRLLHPGSLADDPTRVIRAARYAARLDFAVDDGIDAAMQRGLESGAFGRISGDRLRRAFEELFAEENGDVAMETLGRLGVPDAVVPGWGSEPLPSAEARRGSRDPAAGWRRLLEPLSAPLRARIADRLSFSRALRRSTGCAR